MTAVLDPQQVRREKLTQLATIAAECDEAGLDVMAVAILQIIRGAKEAPGTRRMLVNAGACILDSVEAAHRDPRNGVLNEPAHS